VPLAAVPAGIGRIGGKTRRDGIGTRQESQEMRLLGRTQVAHDAMEGLTTAWLKLGYVCGTRIVGSPKDHLWEWESVVTAYGGAVATCEMAFRTELGQRPIEQQASGL
jgi:hypothetical protein